MPEECYLLTLSGACNDQVDAKLRIPTSSRRRYEPHHEEVLFFEAVVGLTFLNCVFDRVWAVLWVSMVSIMFRFRSSSAISEQCAFRERIQLKKLAVHLR